MRLLSLILGPYPTSRPDIAALFGHYLPKFGIRTDLVAQSLDDSVTSTEWEGGRTYLCPRTGSRSKDQIIAFLHDIRMLWRARPDVYDAIQVRDKVFVAVVAIWIARRRKIPVLYWMSFPMSEVYIEIARTRGPSLGPVRWLFLLIKGHVGKLLLYHYVLPHCTHVFVQSDHMRARIVALGVQSSRTTPVPMGVDLERQVPARSDAVQHMYVSHGRRVMAYIGSFEQFRKVDFLLEVLKELTGRGVDAILLMIGGSDDPADEDRLKRVSQTLGIADRVIWTGWVAPAETWRWLINAEVGLSVIPRGPLYDCASPTKLIEYLALGIPAVANDLPDQKTILQESGAGICCQMDCLTVASAVEQILTNSQLAEEMRIAGPRYVALERGYDRISGRLAAVYGRIAAARQSDSSHSDSIST